MALLDVVIDVEEVVNVVIAVVVKSCGVEVEVVGSGVICDGVGEVGDKSDAVVDDNTVVVVVDKVWRVEWLIVL